MSEQYRNDDEIRTVVRESYGAIARSGSAGCGCAPTSCCSDTATDTARHRAEQVGYSEEELKAAPNDANLGLGCGNPQAIAALRSGETVLDLGSGGGFDCFLAAQRVGDTGRVIGIDMTPDMISLARKNAEKGGYANVEFRLGEIEHLPVADGSVDVILSNCVINLSPDKASVYRDAYRALRPGGRLAIFDVVATAPLPDALRNDWAMYSGCIAGAAEIDRLEQILTDIGFRAVQIQPNEASRDLIRQWMPGQKFADYVVSASIEAQKPLS
jgi:SAM-dependent methyltransferase